MMTLLAVVHVIVAIGLIAFVLLQDPKGGAAGVFGGGGGGSNSLFGATGAGNFLTTGTRWLAILFAVSCVTLAYVTTESNRSVMDQMIDEPRPQAINSLGDEEVTEDPNASRPLNPEKDTMAPSEDKNPEQK